MSRGQLIAIAIFAAMIVGGIAFMIYDGQRFSAAESWASAEGRIVRSEVQLGGSTHNTTYRPYVMYEYVVGGRRLRGEQIWPTGGIFYENEDEAREFMRPYSVGNRVQVFYDPVNPADAALLIESMGGPMILIIVFAVLGIAGTYYYPRLAAWSVRNSPDVPTPQQTAARVESVHPRLQRGMAVFRILMILGAIAIFGSVIYGVLTAS